MEDHNTYRHGRLESLGDFRILQLFPASKGAALRGKIELRRQTDAAENDNGHSNSYDALSYCHGPLEPAAYITLDAGKRLKISQNCAEALRHLRRPKRRCRLWVDSICIDQSSSEAAIQERSQQVMMMGTIFANARQVIAWLGPADPEIELLFEELSLIAGVSKEPLLSSNSDTRSSIHRTPLMGGAQQPRSTQESHGNGGSPEKDPNQFASGVLTGFYRGDLSQTPTFPYLHENSAHFAANHDISRSSCGMSYVFSAYENQPRPDLESEKSSFDGNSILTLVRLLRNPYFKSCWTLQEVSQSQKCVLVCGTCALEWRDMAYAICWIENWIQDQQTAEDLTWLVPFKNFCELSMKCEQLRQTRHSGQALITSKIRDVREIMANQAALIPLLSMLRMQKATRPVDKIFAIYGLMELYMDSTTVCFPPPDYLQPASHAFVDASLTWMVYTGKPLEILKMVPSSWAHCRLPDLPSWVPDWSDSDAPTFPFTGCYFNASRSGNQTYRLDRRKHGFEVELVSSLDSSTSLSAQAPLGGTPKLYVHAKFLGRIVRRSYRVMHEDYLPPAGADDQIASELADSHRARCLLDWFRFVNPTHADTYTPTGEQMLTALYSVLLGFSTVDTKQSCFSPRALLSLFDSDLLDKAPIEPANARLHANLARSSNAAALSVAEAMCPRPHPPTYLHIYLTSAGMADAIQFIRGVTRNATENALFETDNFYLGTANERLQVGDVVALLDGANVPFVLRERQRKRDFTVVGPAYVHGVMYGEAWKTAGKLRRIALV